MNEPHITVIGNLGADPRTRVLDSGAVVTDFRIASTPRKQDRATQVWSDGETIWFSISCWKALAEHCATSLHKGDRVVVTGRLTASVWTGEDGKERSGLEVTAAAVGFDLSRGKVTQERGVPLTVTSDPGFRSTGEVDVVTGEVRMTSGGELPDDDLAAFEDELEPVPAGV